MDKKALMRLCVWGIFSLTLIVAGIMLGSLFVTTLFIMLSLYITYFGVVKLDEIECRSKNVVVGIGAFIVVAVIVFISAFHVRSNSGNIEYKIPIGEYDYKRVSVAHEGKTMSWFDGYIMEIKDPVCAIRSDGTEVAIYGYGASDDFISSDIDEILETSVDVVAKPGEGKWVWCTGKWARRQIGFLLGYLVLLIAMPMTIFIDFCKKIIAADRMAKANVIDSFYEKCLSANIYDVDSEEGKKNIIIVGRGYGYRTLEEAVKKYKQGQKQAQEKQTAALKKKEKDREDKIQAEQQKLKDARNKERKTYIEKLNLSKIVGKEKYIRVIDPMLQELNEEYSSREKIDPMSIYATQRKDNWGWIGGIADGLAGPAAGIMAASQYHEEVEQHNANAREYNRQLIEMGITPDKLRKNKENVLHDIGSKIYDLEETKKFISTAIFDDECCETYLTQMKFAFDYTITKYTKYMTINACVTPPEKIELLSKPAFIDGAFKINVLNAANKIVGEAYLCGNNGEDINEKTFYLDKVGFAEAVTYEITAVPTVEEGFDENETYHFEAVPVALWVMEQIEQ